jgi:hypothetical protein
VPTVLRQHGLRVVIRLNDHPPPHVHVRAAECEVKMTIRDCRVMNAWGASAAVKQRVRNVVRENREHLLEAWERIHGEGL